MESNDVIRALAALAQETRLAAYRLLVEAGPSGLAAGRLAERLGVPAPTLSFHLAHLAQAGLISARRTGRSLIYSADFAAMTGLIAFLTENCCGGAACGAPSCAEPRPDPSPPSLAERSHADEAPARSRRRR